MFYVKTEATLDLFTEILNPHILLVKGVTRPPLVNASVDIYVSLDNGSTWMFFTNTTTDEHGKFEISMNLTVGGKLALKAVVQETEYSFEIVTDPLTVKLLSPEVERLEEELASVKEQLNKTVANMSILAGEKIRLEGEIEKLAEELNASQREIEEIKSENLALKEEVEKYMNEANFYSILALNGIPLILLGGVVVGILLGRKYFSKAK